MESLKAAGAGAGGRRPAPAWTIPRLTLNEVDHRPHLQRHHEIEERRSSDGRLAALRAFFPLDTSRGRAVPGIALRSRRGDGFLVLPFLPLHAPPVNDLESLLLLFGHQVGTPSAMTTTSPFFASTKKRSDSFHLSVIGIFPFSSMYLLR